MKHKRIVYIDVIRVVAMFLVILAHACSARYAVRDGSSSWNMVNLLVVVTEVAVPLFFMISGATILNSKRTTDIKYLYKHRLVRLVIPFMIWSVISSSIFCVV